MQAFLASDVVYSQRVAPLIKEALDEDDIGGQTIADEPVPARPSPGSTPPTRRRRARRHGAGAADGRRRARPARPRPESARRSAPRRCSPAPASTASRPAGAVDLHRQVPEPGRERRARRRGHASRSTRRRASRSPPRRRSADEASRAAARSRSRSAQAPPVGTPPTLDRRGRPRSRARRTTRQQPQTLHGPVHALAAARESIGPAAYPQRAVDDLTTTPGSSRSPRLALALVALVGDRASLARRLRRLRADQRSVLGDGGSATSSPTPPSCSASSRSLHDYVERRRRRASTAGWAPPSTGSTARSPTAALVRYDAYNEMSGRQSTSIALLDAQRSGIVLSSIHHRDQARLYAKQVRRRAGPSRALARGGGGPARSRWRARSRRAPSASGAAVPDAARATSGPPGTFSEEALRAVAARGGAELVPLPTDPRGGDRRRRRRRRARARARSRTRSRARSNATLDTLARDAPTRAIVGEAVLRDPPLPDRARAASAAAQIAAVVSHPQALAQCARFLRERAARRRACAPPPRRPRRCAAVAERRASRGPRWARRSAAELLRLRASCARASRTSPAT